MARDTGSDTDGGSGGGSGGAAKADLIEVRGGREEPTHFLWRERIYAVLEVLGHWTEGWPGSRTAPVVAEREVWRVQASRGRCFDADVYDLSFDRAAGRWTLTSAAA